ncbi:MAG: hypothetical protein DIU83_04160 [Bacillota bacterium]|nr:MAG: hypothetical protein DIU83_04160 [Bacillota bacterium]
MAAARVGQNEGFLQAFVHRLVDAAAPAAQKLVHPLLEPRAGAAQAFAQPLQPTTLLRHVVVSFSV